MDPFDLLGLPKRPLLSEEEIGNAYRRLAGELHPDQAGGDDVRFKELGEAAALLRDPARRLRSLIDQTPGSTIPSEAADLFSRVATLLREADELLARHSNASNPLAKAVLAAPLKKPAADLQALLTTIESWHSLLDARLAALDAMWPSEETTEIASLADSFSYVIRWESQLRERKLSLNCL
jgi:curved DNA-binding protein CbpA